ncbi:MAG: DNA gyrase inhibitor YacG, partial [Planctomycetes bacterium]|nr:DNA gyrase inhibitor YacG [Planctomycetota bacterium]
MELKCPICRKIVKISSRKSPDEMKFFPFCTERCKLID